MTFWETRAASLDDEVLAYIIAVFDSDKEVSQLRVVQSIVTHLEKYPLHRAQAACRRAHYFGCFTYRGIKDILLRALGLLPLPPSESPPPAPSSSVPPLPLFARPIASLLPPKEDSHDWN